MRSEIDFNESWIFIKKNISYQEVLKHDGELVDIPHTWNAFDGQDGGNDYIRDAFWYIKRFKKPELNKGQQLYIEFSAVNQSAEIFLNGQNICKHKGGYSLFRVNITGYLNKNNVIAVRADNSMDSSIYPQNADFTFYGGIYRHVKMLVVENSHFNMDDSGSCGVKITPRLSGLTWTVSAEYNITNKKNNQEVILNILDKDGNIVAYDSEQNGALIVVAISNPQLWKGRIDPYLYTASLKLKEDETVLDEIKVRFGLRTFSIDPNKGFFLNGKPYPLRGVSRYQDIENKGYAISRADHEIDMKLINEVGANSIRLAHYQQDSYFYDLCDIYGMIVWAEIPKLTPLLQNGHDYALQQMTELILQNYNHTSILFWGISNDIPQTSLTEELISQYIEINNLCHKLDKMRLTVMANDFLLESNSPILKISDIFAYNHYMGWKTGTVENNGLWLDKLHKDYNNIPIGLSEYGASGMLDWQTENPQMGDYTETYQALYHEKMLEIISSRGYLWCTYCWNMFDFGSDIKNEGGVKGRNNKGLVTFDRKIKKDSFYVYKAWWSDEPFVHIAGQRFVNRAGKETEIVVFSNLKFIELFVNGENRLIKKGNHVFKFVIDIEKGVNAIQAISGEYKDEIKINGVNKEDTSYNFTEFKEKQ